MCPPKQEPSGRTRRHFLMQCRASRLWRQIMWKEAVTHSFDLNQSDGNMRRIHNINSTYFVTQKNNVFNFDISSQVIRRISAFQFHEDFDLCTSPLIKVLCIMLTRTAGCKIFKQRTSFTSHSVDNKTNLCPAWLELYLCYVFRWCFLLL